MKHLTTASSGSSIKPAPAEAWRYKEMIMNELEECVVQALKMLLQYDSDLIKTQPKEECINHKLAQYLESVLHEKTLLDGRDVDIEYNKYKEDEKKSSNGRNIRPDIIVHERKSGNRNNLIVIEAKKNYDAKGDRGKVTELVNSEDFRYTVGAVISYPWFCAAHPHLWCYLSPFRNPARHFLKNERLSMERNLSSLSLKAKVTSWSHCRGSLI